MKLLPWSGWPGPLAHFFSNSDRLIAGNFRKRARSVVAVAGARVARARQGSGDVKDRGVEQGWWTGKDEGVMVIF